jgi:hypothetical protein
MKTHIPVFITDDDAIHIDGNPVSKLLAKLKNFDRWVSFALGDPRNVSTGFF